MSPLNTRDGLDPNAESPVAPQGSAPMDKAIEYHKRMKEIKKEQWISASEFMQAIAEKDFAKLVSTIKNLRISELITMPFQKLFSVFDNALVEAFSAEIEELFTVVLTEENIEKVTDLAGDIHELYKAMDELSEAISGGGIIENIGLLTSGIGLFSHQVEQGTDMVKDVTAAFKFLNDTLMDLKNTINDLISSAVNITPGGGGGRGGGGPSFDPINGDWNPFD